MRLFVVSESPPPSSVTVPSGVAMMAPQPPGPGLPVHAPSQKTMISLGAGAASLCRIIVNLHTTRVAIPCSTFRKCPIKTRDETKFSSGGIAMPHTLAAIVFAFVLSTTAALAETSHIDVVQPTLVDAPPSHVYVPLGFDDNDNVQIVLD